MLDFLKSDTFILVILAINVVLFIMVITSNRRIKKIKKDDRDFMRKLGDGVSIKDDLKTYMDRVFQMEKEINELKIQVTETNSQFATCFQKIGIVRYNAYKDTGGELSFAVALLDNNDDGIVFNGIYSREMSNIYAKPVASGKSNYSLTQEEDEAISKAMDSNNTIRRKKS